MHGTSTVLAVFAHPDDESLMCGGTIARLSDAGVNVVLMCASRGERGSVSEPSLLADGDLGVVRTRELMEAAAILGVSGRTLRRWMEGVRIPPAIALDRLAALARGLDQLANSAVRRDRRI